jgi:O-antigen/teichoic acid export membrane protein
MTTPTSRGMIKSMLIIGSAQFVNILISIIRMKVVAVLLGPSGVGLLSIYNSLLSMVQQTAGLGMGSSGVREIASSHGDEATLSRVRRVLFAAHLLQGTLVMLAVWLLRERIAIWLFGDAVRATEVGLIGVAILIGLLAAAQKALLQGLRKIGDLGRVTVIGAFGGTLVGLAAVWLQGESGLIWFILVQPLAAVLIALHYTRRLPKPIAARLTLFETWEVWKPMAKLGAAFMLGGLATTATLLLVRGRISQELGLDAAGHFAAAWGLTMTYVGFLLRAMGADYYPRLTEVIHNKVAAVQLMNDQAQIGLAIGGPLLLLLIGLAPRVITLLYSKEFAPAVELLQWQSVGNVFKLAGWALGFSIVAAGRSKTFFLLQVNFNVIFLLLLWPTLTKFGIAAAGPAFTIAYLLQLTAVFLVVRVVHNFRWQPLSLKLLFLHGSLAVVLLAAAQNFPVGVAAASIALALGTGVFGIRVVLSKIGNQGSLPIRLYGIFARLGWPIRPAV